MFVDFTERLALGLEHGRIATIEPDTIKCYEKVIVLERFSHNH